MGYHQEQGTRNAGSLRNTKSNFYVGECDQILNTQNINEKSALSFQH